LAWQSFFEFWVYSTVFDRDVIKAKLTNLRLYSHTNFYNFDAIAVLEWIDEMIFNKKLSGGEILGMVFCLI